VLTSKLDEIFPDKNKIGIRLLNSISEPIHYKEIKNTVNGFLENDGATLAK
jgi:hypothetical protein